MENHRVILLDGVNTLIYNENFIRDDIPRMLANYLEKGYELWLISESYDATQKWNSLNCIPNWLMEQTVVIDFDFVVKNYGKYTSDSMVITNRPKFFTNMKLKTISLETKYKPLRVADVIFCFGFTKPEFIRFCSNTKSIGIIQERFINKTVSNPDGVAFFIDENVKELESEAEFAVGCLNRLITNKNYKIQYRKKVIGVTNKGKGIKDVNLDIGNIEIPMLLI